MYKGPSPPCPFHSFSIFLSSPLHCVGCLIALECGSMPPLWLSITDCCVLILHETYWSMTVHELLTIQSTPPPLVTVFEVNGRNAPSHSLFYSFTASLQLSLTEECFILKQTEDLSLFIFSLQSSFLCLLHWLLLNESLVCLQFSNDIDWEHWFAVIITGGEVAAESERWLG